jgi:hypothetical protein
MKIACACCLCPHSAACLPVARTRSWTAGGGTNLWLWSDPAHWDPHGVPQNGEDLWFSDPLNAGLLKNNDLPNLTVRSLGFAIGNIGDANVHLYGYPLGVSHGISNTYDFECQVYIHCDVRLAGNATFVTGNTETKPTFTLEDVAMHFIAH